MSDHESKEGYEVDYYAEGRRLGSYDVAAAIHYASKESSNILAEIDSIVLEITGENDGPEWHWILRMKDGTFAYLHGGCDYTGWDCQAGADFHRAEATMESVLKLVGEVERRVFEDMISKGEKARLNTGGL